MIRKNGAGALVNPEFGIDLSDVVIYDVGYALYPLFSALRCTRSVRWPLQRYSLLISPSHPPFLPPRSDITPGLPIEEANGRLAATIAEIVRRGAVPFVLGGSTELCYGVAVGLMAVAGGALAVLHLSPQLDVRPAMPNDPKYVHPGPFRQLLEDARFCPPRSGLSNHSCDGRLVIFGAQGALCPMDHANFVTQHGGKVVWLSKDLRQPQAIFGAGSGHGGAAANDGLPLTPQVSPSPAYTHPSLSLQAPRTFLGHWPHPLFEALTGLPTPAHLQTLPHPPPSSSPFPAPPITGAISARGRGVGREPRHGQPAAALRVAQHARAVPLGVPGEVLIPIPFLAFSPLPLPALSLTAVPLGVPGEVRVDPSQSLPPSPLPALSLAAVLCPLRPDALIALLFSSFLLPACHSYWPRPSPAPSPPLVPAAWCPATRPSASRRTRSWTWP